MRKFIALLKRRLGYHPDWEDPGPENQWVELSANDMSSARGELRKLVECFEKGGLTSAMLVESRASSFSAPLDEWYAEDWENTKEKRAARLEAAREDYERAKAEFAEPDPLKAALARRLARMRRTK